MITLIIITIVGLALSLFIAPYVIQGAELQISLIKGALIGVNLDGQYDAEDDISDYTLQVGLGLVLFTLTWES